MAIENAKTLNVRIRNKYDSYENWASSSLVLEAGEIAIAYTTVDVTVDNGTAKHPALLMKVGDGSSTFANLPWLSAKAADVVAACKSTEALTTFVSNVIANSGIATDEAMTALAGRVTTAEGEIDTLQSEMDAVEAKAAANEAAIAVLDGLVGDKSVNTQIQEYIAGLNLADTYAAKSLETTVANHVADTVAHVTTADKTKWNAALQASDVASGSANGTIAVKGTDVAVTGLGSAAFTERSAYDASGSASAAETAAKAYAKEYADGLAGNYDAKGSAAAAQSAAETYAKNYADGLATNYDAAGSAAQALTDAKAYTDSEMERLVGDTKVSEQISGAIADLDLANTYAAKVHTHVKADITDFAHTHEMSEVNGLVDALAGKETAGAAADALAEAKEYADGKDAAIEAAQAAADKAQEEVDALETYVGTIPEGYTESSVIAYINKKAEETLASASGNSTETAASVKAALDTYKAENDAAVKANADAIDALEELVGDTKVSEAIAAAVATETSEREAADTALSNRVKAIEDDYLKAADKTELQGNIDTVSAAVERLTNGVSADEIDGVNDLINYVNTHGTEVTGMKADIKANADAIDAIEADYLKAADKTELAGDITALEGRMDTVEGAVATKAEAADLTALAGRVTTVEGDLNTETTGLKARMTQAEADIDALETKVGDETVAAQIEAAIEALKIGDYAKAADLTAAVERIAAAEGKITTLEGEMDTAQADIEALETEVAKKANDADLAAIAKTGSTDDLVQGSMTLVFDCGTSAV